MSNVQFIESLIAKNLSEIYPSVKVFQQEIPNGSVFPCFFISLKNAKLESKLQKKVSVKYTFKITLMDTENLYEKADDIFFNLQYIGNKQFKSSEISLDISKDKLDFLASYTLSLIRNEETGSKMNQLERNTIIYGKQ